MKRVICFAFIMAVAAVLGVNGHAVAEESSASSSGTTSGPGGAFKKFIDVIERGGNKETSASNATAVSSEEASANKDSASRDDAAQKEWLKNRARIKERLSNLKKAVERGGSNMKTAVEKGGTNVKTAVEKGGSNVVTAVERGGSNDAPAGAQEEAAPAHKVNAVEPNTESEIKPVGAWMSDFGAFLERGGKKE